MLCLEIAFMCMILREDTLKSNHILLNSLRQQESWRLPDTVLQRHLNYTYTQTYIHTHRVLTLIIKVKHTLAEWTRSVVSLSTLVSGQRSFVDVSCEALYHANRYQRKHRDGVTQVNHPHLKCKTYCKHVHVILRTNKLAPHGRVHVWLMHF